MIHYIMVTHRFDREATDTITSAWKIETDIVKTETTASIFTL